MFAPWGCLERFIKQESHIFSRERQQICFVDNNNDSWNGLCLITQHSIAVGLCCRTVSKQMGQQEEVVVWEGYNFTTEWQHGPRTDPDIQAIVFLLTCSPTSPGLSLFWKLTCCMKGKLSCPCSDTLSKLVCSQWDWLVFASVRTEGALVRPGPGLREVLFSMT